MNRRESGIVDFPIKRLWFRFRTKSRRSRAIPFFRKCMLKQAWRINKNKISHSLHSSTTKTPPSNNQENQQKLKILQHSIYIRVFVAALFFFFFVQRPNRVQNKIEREESTQNKEKRKDAPHSQMRNGEVFGLRTVAQMKVWVWMSVSRT